MNKFAIFLFRIFVFFIPILIYAPVFNGTSIWDDNYFIFDRYRSQDITHFIIWKDFVWPFFDSLTLILYKLFGIQTLPWHVVNFVIHILNGFLIGSIIARFKPKLKYLMILIFWIHPLSALSVGWIIQLKTLISMFFCLSAFYVIQLDSRRKSILALSIFLFTLSVTSKSSTVLVPFMALLWCLLRKNWRIHTIKTLPFIFISLLSLYRMSWNDYFQKSVQISESTVPNMIVDFDELPVESGSSIAQNDPAPLEHLNIINPQEQIEPENIPKIEIQKIVTESTFTNKLKIMAYTTSYYLAAPWLPYDLSPIHSNYRGGFNFKNYFGLALILASLSLIFFKHYWALICLASQIFLLLPFLGIVIAPYMKFSIVSEQHLYIALPFAILAQILLIQYVFKGYQKVSQCFFVILLSVLTAGYTPTFKNEETFYRRVLSVYPYDRLSALNLANFYFKRGSIRQANYVLRKALSQAEEHAYLKEDIMHEYMVKTFERIQELKDD